MEKKKIMDGARKQKKINNAQSKKNLSLDVSTQRSVLDIALDNKKKVNKPKSTPIHCNLPRRRSPRFSPPTHHHEDLHDRQTHWTEPRPSTSAHNDEQPELVSSDDSWSDEREGAGVITGPEGHKERPDSFEITLNYGWFIIKIYSTV